MTEIEDVERWVDEKDTKALINALGDRDFRIVWRAAKALGEMVVKEAVPQLIPLLRHSNRFVRGRAAEALLKLEGKKALPYLRENIGIFEDIWVIKTIINTAAGYREKWALDYILEFMDTFNPKIGKLAYYAILVNWRDIPDYAVKKLEPYENFLHYGSILNEPYELKSDEDEGFTEMGGLKWSNELVGRLGESIEEILNEMEEEFPFFFDIEEYWKKVENMDFDENYEISTNFLLGYFTEDQSKINELLYKNDFETLIRAAGDEDDDLHQAGIFVISGLPLLPPFEEVVTNVRAEDDTALVKGALRFYSLRDVEGAGILIGGVLHGARDENKLIEAVKALRALGLREFIPELERLATGTCSDALSIEAIFALGEMLNEEAARTIVKLVEDNRPKRRTAALLALGKSRHPAAVKPVIEKLRNIREEANAEVRRACVLSAGWIAGETITGELKSIMEWEKRRAEKDEDSVFVMEALVRTIGEIGGEEAVDFLISCLHEDNPVVSAIAANELGRTGAKKAVPELLKAAEGCEDPATRYFALQALCRIGDRKAMPALKRRWEQGDEDEAAIRTLLFTAMINLDSDPTLLNDFIFGLDPNDVHVWDEVLLLAENLTNPDAEPVLLQIINESDLNMYRIFSMTALRKIITNRSISTLKKMLRNNSPDFIQSLSVWLLAKLRTPEAMTAIVQFVKKEVKKMKNGEEIQDFPFFLGIVYLLTTGTKAIVPILRNLKKSRNTMWQGFTQVLIDLISEPRGKERVEEAFWDIFSLDNIHFQWEPLNPGDMEY